MPRANDVFKDVKRLLEARKPTTCTVGKIVGLPNGKAAIMVNGNPEGEVVIDKLNGKKRVTIKYMGETLEIFPSSNGGKFSSDDIQKMKEDVASIYYGEVPLYFGTNKAKAGAEDNTKTDKPVDRPVLKKGEKVVEEKEFPEFYHLTDYLAELTGEDFEDMRLDCPDPNNNNIFEFVKDNGKPYKATIHGKTVKFQAIENDHVKLYIIQVPERMTQGSLF